MKMKKKVLTTSLAASLIVGSVASLPAYATSATLPASAGKYITVLNNVYSKLTAEDITTLKAVRTQVLNLTDASVIDPIWVPIQEAIGNNTADYPNLSNKQKLFDFVKAFNFTYAESTETLAEIYANPDYRAILSELFVLGGEDPVETGDFDELVALADAVQAAVKAKIEAALKAADYEALLNIRTSIETAVKGVLNSDNYKATRALKNVDVTVADVLATRAKITAAVPAYASAEEALAVAYLKTLDLKDTSGGGGGGGGGIDTTPKGPDKAAATTAITNVANKLADLLADNKGNGLAKATEAIQRALREASVVDVSKAVSVSGDKATAKLEASQLADLFKTVKEIAAAANEKLKAAAPGAAPAKVIATLNLGTVSAGTIEIPLSKDVLAKAKENGIEVLALKVNGVVVALELDQFGAEATVNLSKKAASVIPSTTLKAASDVYDFGFVVDGKSKESFSKPVEVRFPVSLTGVDEELLVFTKIDGSDLIFKGGKYSEEDKDFVVANKSFSTYTILENKVNFADITSVKDWAGHQISVAAAKGILDGRAEGQFVPNAEVTRAEFAKMIVKAFGLEDAAATESFSDVGAADWYQPYVAAAAQAGLIEGRAEGVFAPEATITRAEMATIASRALAKFKSYQAVEETNTALAVFKDAASIDATLKAGVALAAEQGLVVGEEGSQFNPENDTTRAQAAVVVYRLLNK